MPTSTKQLLSGRFTKCRSQAASSNCSVMTSSCSIIWVIERRYPYMPHSSRFARYGFDSIPLLVRHGVGDQVKFLPVQSYPALLCIAQLLKPLAEKDLAIISGHHGSTLVRRLGL